MLDRIPNKRAFLAGALGTAKVPGLLERLIRRRRPMFAVLTYHRIAVPGVRSDPFYDPVISATPEAFERQMEFVRRHFQPIPMDDLRDPGALGPRLAGAKRPLVLVTFDDGYRDNVEVALPVLRKLAIPATFFIPTGFLAEPRLPWWDRVACVLKRTEAESLTLRRHAEDPAPAVLTLGHRPDDATRQSAITQAIGLFLRHEVPDEEWFLAQLEREARVELDAEGLGRRLFMTWYDLPRLEGSGVSVGAHGHSHQPLARLSEDRERQELSQSKRALEAALGREVFAVAYPFGWEGTFTQRTRRIAAEVGYEVGFSSLEGVNQPGAAGFEPLCLRRLNVGTGDSGPLLRARAALHGTFGRSIL